VHGGGFTGGDRRHAVAPLREALSNGDFVWFSIDYRLAPAYKPSDASEDLNAALRFVRDHAREFKVDTSRIALLGESAGAYLALMAAARLGISQIQAVVAVGGPTQLWALAPEMVAHVEEVFHLRGGAELRAVSPISCVSSSMPPVLLLHGSNDNHVPLAQAQALCRTVQAMQFARFGCTKNFGRGYPGITESQKLVRDLWNYAAKQRRLLTEATHAIVGLTRSLGDGEELADHTAVLDEVEAVDLQIAGAVSEHAILDARVRCFYSTHCIDADDEEAQTWQRDEAGRRASIASPSPRRPWHLRQRLRDSAPAGSTFFACANIYIEIENAESETHERNHHCSD